MTIETEKDSLSQVRSYLTKIVNVLTSMTTDEVEVRKRFEPDIANILILHNAYQAIEKVKEMEAKVYKDCHNPDH